MNTLGKIQEIFCDVFDDQELLVTRETTADEIEDWDSFAQVNLVVACESEFGIKFDLNEMGNMKSVADFVDIIERKLG